MSRSRDAYERGRTNVVFKKNYITNKFTDRQKRSELELGPPTKNQGANFDSSNTELARYNLLDGI